MVLRYFGEDVSEAELIEALKVNERDGTYPTTITAYFRKRGFHARDANSIAAIERSTSAGRPVIVDYQDWAHRPTETDYATAWDNGHYAVALGLEKGRIWLADPSSGRKRRSLAVDDFERRWHDIENDGRRFFNWGVSIGPKR